MDWQIKRSASRRSSFSNQLTKAPAETSAAAHRRPIEMSARPFSDSLEHGHLIKNLIDKHT
jgi:hypothetical protein